MSKTQSKGQDIVLSYHDCLLRESDVKVLDGPYWLNDAIIGFYFEYLGQKYEESSPKLLFISPELAQLLKLSDPQEYSIFLDPIEGKEKDFIFFPINDCDSRSKAGGSHWSLMVFSKPEKTCFYFDSARGLNTSVARNFTRSIISYLLGNDVPKSNRQFVDVYCSQQENGYDCGLFVLCFADIISEHVLKTSKIEGSNCDNVSNQVANKRKSLIALIEELKVSKV